MPQPDPIAHLQQVISHNTRRLQKLQEQAAKKGDNTPPEVRIEIEDIEAELEALWSRLRTLAPGIEEAGLNDPYAGWFLAHPYGMPPGFTGRADELALLDAWLERDPAHPLLVIRALGGFGKSALTWHWLTQIVDPARRPQAVWWSFYEPNATFEQFLTETLTYLGVPTANLSPSQQTNILLQTMQRPRCCSSLMALSALSAPTAASTLPTRATNRQGSREVEEQESGGEIVSVRWPRLFCGRWRATPV